MARCVFPTPGSIPTNCTRFGEFAGTHSGAVAAPPVVRCRAGGARLALHRWRSSAASASCRWQHRVLASGVDQPAGHRSGCRTLGIADARRVAQPSPTHRSAQSPACTTRPRTPTFNSAIASPPGRVIHLEVSPMPPYRINPVRQLRLTLPESDSVWPDEVWDGLPDAVRREALRRLAELLRRWLASSEQRS